MSFGPSGANVPTNHSTIGPAAMGVAWALLPITTVVIALRFYVKCFMTRKITLDDWLILVALVFEYVHTSLVTVAYSWGMGHHFFALADQSKLEVMKWVFLSQMWAVSSSMIARVSFCVFLLAIVGPTSKWQKCTLWAIIAVQIVINVATIIQVYTTCGAHLDGNWNTSLGIKCVNADVQEYLGFVQSGFNSVSDLALTVLPAMILWELKMKMSLKIGLLSVLCLNVFAFAASCAKAVEIKNIGANNDFTHNMVYLIICLCIEENVVMMAASIPTLRPLLRRNGGTLANSYERSGSGSGGAKPRPVSKNSHISSRSSGTMKSPKEAYHVDRMSEEYMLEAGGNHGLGIASRPHIISKTTDVSVTYAKHDKEFDDTANHDGW